MEVTNYLCNISHLNAIPAKAGIHAAERGTQGKNHGGTVTAASCLQQAP